LIQNKENIEKMKINEEEIIKCNEEIKYSKKKEKEEKKKEIFENKLSAFGVVSITTVVGYACKYLIINVWFSKMKYQYENEFIINNNMEYVNVTNNNSEYTINTNNNTNFTIFNEKFYHHDKRLFIYIGLAYFICLLWSMILYFFFTKIFEPNKNKKKKENETKENKYIINKIFGCILYCEKSSTEDSTSINESCCCKCCKLCCKSIQKYCDNIICEGCCCCFCQLVKMFLSRDDDDYEDCDEKCRCVCPCYYCSSCQYNENDYDKNHDIFLYIYREKRCCYWFNDYLNNKTQKKIIPFVVEYFFLKLATISFEKEYENTKKDKLFDLKQNIGYCCVFLVSLYILVTVSNRFNSYNDYRGSRCSFLCNPFTTVYLFQFLFSIIGFFWKNHFFLYFILLINKLYFIALNYYIITFSESEKGIELISLSPLTSVYISFFDSIILILKWIVTSNNTLYIIQILFSMLPIELIGLLIVALFLFLIINIFFLYYFRFKCDKHCLNVCEIINDYRECICHCPCCNDNSVCYNEKCINDCSSCEFCFDCFLR